MNKLHLKKFNLFLILMLVSVSAAFAQGYNTVTWKFSNPKQFGFTITDVDYFDNNNVLAVGFDGGIAKSTDAGRNWTYGVFTYIDQNGFQVKPSFQDVHFISSTVAYAVGLRGLMVKTTDAGVTWNVVTTPLWDNIKDINTCWFLDANKGYIGGQVNNTADSLPKIYVTLNGGATWDSIAAPPVNGASRVGYIGNALIPSVLYPIDAKMKTIYRIQFINDSTGYVLGSGSPLFPAVSNRATSSTVCTPLATFLTSSAMSAGLLWKFKSGVLTDYSISKERIGYTGINTNTINCTTTFSSVTPNSQTYKAMNIINDSTVVIASFNNNIVIKVNTGVNDSTENVNDLGTYEKGKYEMLNFPNPPTQGPDAGPSIPPVQVYLVSNPLQIIRNSGGKLYTAGAANTFFGSPGRMFASVDTGRNWIEEVPYPQTPQIVTAAPGAQAIAFAPNGRLLVGGNNGAVADSLPGGNWFSNWSTTPVNAAYNDMEFVDCNNGIAAGGSSITVTTDGGNTWIDRFSAVLQALNGQINSVNYVSLTKAYFTTSIGNLYRSANQGATLSPVFAEPLARLTDLATIGNDSLWMTGVYINSPNPSANRQAAIYRSFDNGANWDTVRVGPMGASTYLQFNKIQMASRLIGYVAGNRNSIWKTIDGGATWTDVSPVPSLSANMNYTGLQALNTDTVFATGNGFPAKVIYRTTDGGATWVDITNNLTSLGGGNINGINMHNVDSGYAVSPGGYLFITNNGGASWTLDIAPTGNLFTAIAFVPATVGPNVSMTNRKLFVSGPNINGAPMMEYGNAANTTVNTTELIVDASCSAPNSGSITITATGGIAPYMYGINGGPLQVSNVFTGLAAATYTIEIRDAYCGLLTKSVTVGQTDDQVITVTPASATVCAGVPVQLLASGNSTSYSWSPTTGLSNPNIANPIATVNTTTTYTVTGTLNNCTKLATVTITVNPNSSLVILADPGTTLCEGDPTLLTVYDGAGVANVNLT
ncbi:MAG: YCF48-related protein, partial [Ferruginibacter sp.]